MKVVLWVLVLSFALAPGLRAAPPAGSAWQLTFSDEFNGTALDTSVWTKGYRWSPTPINGELWYPAPDAYEEAGGLLRIRADRRTMGGFDYTSGVITSRNRFSQSYGYFEINARIPAGRGLWPAFWLLPADDSWPPEIDVMEIVDHEPNRVFMTYHYKDGAGNHQGIGMNWVGPDFSQAMHSYGVDWQPGQMIWYIDGVERARTNVSITSQPMYLLADLAVGGGWPGAPDASTVFPAYYDIDYIRAYQRVAETPTSSLTPSRTVSSSPSATPTPSRTPTSSATTTSTPSVSPTASSSATTTPTASSLPSPLATETPTRSVTATGTATPSSTRTLSPLPSAAATGTATLSASPPASPTRSPTATPTRTSPPNATATSSASPVASTADPSAGDGAASGPNQVLEVVPAPDPNPQRLAVRLAGTCERLRVSVYSPSMACLGRRETQGAFAPGWASADLPEALASAANGPYFCVVQSFRGSSAAPEKKAVLWVLH